MSFITIILALLNGVFFLVYGTQCLFTKHMVLEFNRYGLSDGMRVTTGSLQLAATTGLIAGIWWWPTLGMLSSLGLVIMMSVAFAIRVRIRDPLIDMLPSLLFLGFNMWLCIQYFNAIKWLG